MSMQVGPSALVELRRVISDKRLDAYRMGPADEDVDLLARYLWNIALCEALYPALHSLEIALRNSLHAALTASFGVTWYDDPTVLIEPRGRSEVVEAKQRLRTQGKPLEADRIVAELPFGFWTSLLNVAYAQSAVRRPPVHKPLWPTLVAVAFPRFVPVGGPWQDGEHSPGVSTASATTCATAYSITNRSGAAGTTAVRASESR